MTVNIYDGNNVVLRDLLNFSPHSRGGLNIRKRWSETTPNDFWVWDGLGHNKRRQAIYPIYKGQRQPMAEDVFAQVKLFREVLQHSAGTQIEVPEWEADDVIATLARKLAARGVRVVVHSNDLDYSQLEANPNITINGIQKRPTSARWIPLYKACVGDGSDNIKGIPGFGKGTWALLDGEYEWLEQAIVKCLPHAFETLSLPKRVKNWLMDVENIKLAQNMMLITHFFEVPEAELSSGITPGKLDPAAVDQILGKYFL